MLRPLLCAIGFLTRIPVPQPAFSERDAARGAGYFAWVGAIIAAVLWAAAQLSTLAGARTAALGVIVAWALISGGLHLDGLADTVDGFSGGRGKPERTLEIMRDGRIGAHAALALVLVVLLKWTALERLISLGDLTWLATPVLSRFLCTALIAFFPYARAQGLGSVFMQRVALPELLIGALVLCAALGFAGADVLWGALAAAATTLLIAIRSHRFLGGLTGDVYGAAIELSETVCLLVLSLR